jgi:hypothetical protein
VELLKAALAAYDQMIGLDLDDLIGWVDHQIPLRRGTFGSIPGRSR